MIADLISLKQFEQPDEVRHFALGKFEIVRVGEFVLGRATYAPGWRWSLHVGAQAGARACEVEHLGYVVSGCCGVSFDDGSMLELPAGTLFHIPPHPHDSWVVGDQPYVSLHFLGASQYAK